MGARCGPREKRCCTVPLLCGGAVPLPTLHASEVLPGDARLRAGAAGGHTARRPHCEAGAVTMCSTTLRLRRQEPSSASPWEPLVRRLAMGAAIGCAVTCVESHGGAYVRVAKINGS